jgi:hypothetical protein
MVEKGRQKGLECNNCIRNGDLKELIVEDLAPTQTKEETTSGLLTGAVGSPAALGYSLPVNGRNGDTPTVYLARVVLRRKQYGIFAESKNCRATETAIVR